MSCLHTISASPASALLESCLKIIQPGDAILFIEDGVYHCSLEEHLQRIDNKNDVYGLREDMLARATLRMVHDRVEAIDTIKFVELCCRHDKVMSWF